MSHARATESIQRRIAPLLRSIAREIAERTFAVAGAPKGNEDVRLRELAAELGIASRVEFVGLLDDRELARRYATCSCVVFASRQEGFGIPALEARRARAPLAVSRIPALVEVAGESAPSFSPDDAAECARAIRAAVGTDVEQLERSAAAAERFRWDESARLLVEAWTASAQ